MRRHILFVLIATLLAACASTQREAIQVRYFDLGAPSLQVLPKIPLLLQVANFSAPEWLETTTIPYRLAYREPMNVYTYSSSRWVAAPNALLTTRFKSALGGAGVVSPADSIRTGCIVRIALEDFSQTLDSPQTSRVTIRARASLVAIDGKRLIAQTAISVVKPTATADINGAVSALSEGSDTLIGDIVTWLAGTLDAGSPAGQAAIRQCNRS